MSDRAVNSPTAGVRWAEVVPRGLQMRQVWVFAGLWIGLAVGGAGAQTKVAQAGGAAPCPEPKVVSAKPSPLPAEMTDDNFAGALARLRTATTAHGTMVSPMHLRYELKMTDVWGKPHTGTYETWLMLGASRLEIHTDTYDDVEVSTCGVRWVLSHGIRPLRVIEFRNERVDAEPGGAAGGECRDGLEAEDGEGFGAAVRRRWRDRGDLL